MKPNRRLSPRVLVFFAISLPIAGWGQQSFEPDSAKWRFIGDQVTVETVDGRPAIRIRSGSAVLEDIDFENGVIEFDIYTSDKRAFVYLQFRGVSNKAYEDLYFRPHKSGLPDAVQYSPVFQGRSAWQLYHGETGTAAADFPARQWVPIRVELQGATAKIWVGEGEEPVLAINQLGRKTAAGWIGLRGFVPRNSSAAYAAYFSNLRVRKSGSTRVSDSSSTNLPQGQITTWRVSPAFDAAPGAVVTIPQGLKDKPWTTPPMQANGVFEFLRSRTIPENSRHWAVVAEVTLRATKAQTCAMHLGFSDEITLSVNEQLMLYRNAAYRFDPPRQDGVMHPDQVVAYLPLKKGKNLIRAVIADRFGGWGFSSRLPDCEGVAEF